MGRSFSRPKHATNNKKKEDVLNRTEDHSRASMRKRYWKQVKRDRKSQRVTKNQLYKLSMELTKTAWYLGKRLGFDEKELRKIHLKCLGEIDSKRHILMTWRKRNGWRATYQHLVILLEEAGYEYEEYKSALPSLSNGKVEIYEKANTPQPVNRLKSNGYYRYDGYVNTPRNYGDPQKLEDEQSSDKTGSDIIAFARKSWKKPSRKEIGTKLVTSNEEKLEKSHKKSRQQSTIKTKNTEANKVPQSARTTTEKESYGKRLTIRRYSDSTANKSKKYQSEEELSAIFRRESTNKQTTHSHRAVMHQEETAMEENRTSTDSQLHTYRDQIAQISKRHFAISSDTSEESTDSRLPSFQFSVASSYQSMEEQHISGLGITSDDDIVMAESNNKEILIFDRFGNLKNVFSTESELNPKGLYVDENDMIIVCCGKEIRIFSTDGDLFNVFGHGSFRNNCYSVVCDAIGTCYVSDIVEHSISVFDSSRNIRKRFGNFGESLINFNQPVALAISSSNKLLISDSQNHCIKVYSLAGRPLKQIGGQGSADGKFWNPFGICFDHMGRLLVADCGNNRISMFDANFKFVCHLFTEADGIQMPSLVQINRCGQLIVCEWKSDLVKVYSFESAV